jgi:hypothetical protein
MSLLATVSLPVSPYPPIAVGFFGLGTGYLIYGTQELFGYPKRNAGVDFGTGIWGLWMPGFMQLLTGIYLFAGLTLFDTFRGAPALYMAALAFTAYGTHWFPLGWNRMRGSDVRLGLGHAVAFILISILGAIVFFNSNDWPVGLVFVGLTLVYICEVPVSLAPDFPVAGALATRALGFVRLLTGFWLMYLTYSVVLDITLGYTLPK